MLRDFARRTLWASPLLALILAGCDNGGDLASEDADQEPRPVKSIVLESSGTKLSRTYPAVVLPAQQALLSFRSAGQLIELPIRAAQRVNEGDVIAQLDPRDFETEVERLDSQLDQAKAKLIEMESGARTEDVATLQANLDAANARLREAQQQVERTQQLFAQEIVAKTRLDQDVAALEVAEAQLRAATEELNKGQAGAREEEVAQQEAVIRGYETQLTSAQDALRDTTLRAPFSGIIARREVDNFANVQAKETIVELQRLDTIDMIFDVPGPDIAPLAARQESLITIAQIDSLPGENFEATIKEFTTQADDTTQTFRGRVGITPPEGAVILPGMAGQIMVTVDEDDGSYIVPSVAIGAEPDGKPFVWVVSEPDNAVSKRYVTTGEATAQNITITDGLATGDVVVTAGISALRENMRVTPVDKIGD